MKRLIYFVVHNWPLKLGAIGLAITMYGGMVLLQSTTVWPGTIAIRVVNQPADSYLIEPDPLPSVRDIRYIAGPDVPITVDSFSAKIDLSGAKISESEYSFVPVQLVAEDARVQIVDYQPKQIRVALDPIIHKQVPVHVEEGAYPTSLSPGSPIVSASSVDVQGPASFVKQVAYAQAPVRIDSSGLDVDVDADLVARDVKGDAVPNVQFTPRSVHVEIQVGSQIRSETVPVHPVVVGSPASGYNITSVEVQPSVVVVRGQSDALFALRGQANTAAISIAGASAEATQFTVALDLPAGVSTDASTITVIVHLASPLATRTYSVGLTVPDARSDRTYTLSTSSVLVTLSGATAALNALDTSTLVGSISVAGLDTGSFDLTVTVSPPAGIRVVSISPAQIHVTIGTKPAPSPTG